MKRFNKKSIKKDELVYSRTYQLDKEANADFIDAMMKYIESGGSEEAADNFKGITLTYADREYTIESVNR